MSPIEQAEEAFFDAVLPENEREAWMESIAAKAGVRAAIAAYLKARVEGSQLRHNYYAVALISMLIAEVRAP